MVTVERLVVADEAAPTVRHTECPACADVSFVGEGGGRRIGERGDKAVVAYGGEVMRRTR